MKQRGWLVIVAVASAHCGAPPATSVESAIVGGTPERVPSAVVRVDAGDRSCSGVVVAPRWVATARHCVSDVDPRAFACDERAQPIGAGGAIIADRDPAALRVLVGGRSSAVTAIVHDGATHLCAHDVALVELDAAAAATPAPLRIGRGVEGGEWVTVAGFGVDETGQIPSAPRERTIEVRRVGPQPRTAAARAVAPAELETGEGGCGGDSGGPAFSLGGAVVAIYSRGGNDGAGCAGAGARNVYASARALEPLLARALRAGETITDEDGQPRSASDLASIAAPMGGCSFVPTGPGASPAALLVVLALLSALRVAPFRDSV